jgi:hypothetical protein
MDLKRCMLDMFESDNPDIVFEMHFSDPFFIPAQETCSHGWSGLRSTMNDDFMIGQNLAVVECFLSVSEQDEQAYVGLRIFAVAVEPSWFFHVVGFTNNVQVQVDRSFVEEVHDSGEMDSRTTPIDS